MQKVTLLLICSFLCLCHQSNAQGYEWAKLLHTPSGSSTVVKADHDRNVISAGYYYDSVDLNPGPFVNNYTLSTNTLFSSYISKLDSNGDYLWGHVFQTSAEVRVIDIDIDQQDNILVTGQFVDSIDLDFGPSEYMLQGSKIDVEKSIFLAKYDAQGNIIWGRVWTTLGISPANSLFVKAITVDPQDNVILLGHYTSPTDFDPGQGIYYMNVSNLFANQDQYLLKVDPLGNFVWARQWGSEGFWNSTWWSSSNMLDTDPAGNIYFPLSYSDSVDLDPELGLIFVNNNNLLDVSLLKISPAGSLVWHNELAGNGHDYCNALSVDPHGNIFYLINTTSSPIDVDPGVGQVLLNTSSGWAKAILKFDNAGTLLWGKENLPGWSSGWWDEGIAADVFGDVYVYSKIDDANLNNQWDLDPGPGVSYVSSNGQTDIAIQNLDGNGNFIWGGVIGGANIDYCFSVCTDFADGVYFTGYLYQQADLNPFTAVAHFQSTGPSTDPYLLKLNNCNKYTALQLSGCDSVPYLNNYYYADTTIQSIYPSLNGCDSIYAVEIDVHPSYNHTIQVDTCKFYVWNGTTYTNSGTYAASFQSAHACDSFVTLDLNLLTDTVQIVSLQACDSATFNGITYTQTGQYIQHYTSAQGCDSIFHVYFTKNQVDTTILESNDSLTAQFTNAMYQWIDCENNYQLILGATNRLYVPTQTGRYACIISQGSCSDTSNCHLIDLSPQSVKDYNRRVTIYPNPSDGVYTLLLDKEYKNVQLEIRTIKGRIVWNKTYEELQETNFILKQPAGVYLVNISVNGESQSMRILKW